MGCTVAQMCTKGHPLWRYCIQLVLHNEAKSSCGELDTGTNQEHHLWTIFIFIKSSVAHLPLQRLYIYHVPQDFPDLAPKPHARPIFHSSLKYLTLPTLYLHNLFSDGWSDNPNTVASIYAWSSSKGEKQRGLGRNALEPEDIYSACTAHNTGYTSSSCKKSRNEFPPSSKDYRTIREFNQPCLSTKPLSFQKSPIVKLLL